jgi:hypothetical protein
LEADGAWYSPKVRPGSAECRIVPVISRSRRAAGPSAEAAPVSRVGGARRLGQQDRVLVAHRDVRAAQHDPLGVEAQPHSVSS